MSIKGIDAQMMVTRTADILQTANAQLKGSERAQEAISAQNQNAVERDKSAVTKTEKSSEVTLHLGDDGGNGSEAYMQQQNGEIKKDEYNEMLDTELGHSEHIVDMML